MHKNYIKKLLKLQDKDIIIDENLTNISDNVNSIYISKKIKECFCPSCKCITKRIHDYRIQKIKHIPINGCETYLYLKKARLRCKNCDKRFYMDYTNIVNPRFRSSNELFNGIINDLQNYSLTISDVTKKNYTSPGVVTRYLSYFAYFMQWNNITKLPKRIGIDEFKGNCDKSKYCLHIYDLDTSKTVTILRTRKYEDILKFFNSIENRDEVELVTMDLYDTFRNAVKAKLKYAKIVADRFHYTRIISNALDELRLNIWRNTNCTERKYFKNLKLNLMKDIEKVNPKSILKCEEKLNYAFELSGELKYGYQLYQSFLKIKYADSYEEKVILFRDWIDDALSSTLKPFKSAAQTLLRWNKEIINSFSTSYTNSATEGKNNKIKVIKRLGYGYRNLDTLRNLIMLKDCKI